MATSHELHPLAEMLLYGYGDTASFSRAFRDEHKMPPTLLHKAHHLRSVVQAEVHRSDRYVLRPEYAEFGRVLVEDRELERQFLLRSEGALAVERNKRLALFDSTKYLLTNVTAVVYAFHKCGMDISVAGTRRATGRKKYEVTSLPTFVACWPYDTTSPSSPFDQGAADPWRELGDIGDAGEETGDQ